MKTIISFLALLLISGVVEAKPKIQNEDVRGLTDITAAVLTTTGNVSNGSACITSVGSTTGLSTGLFIYDTSTPVNIASGVTIAGLPGTCSAGQIQMSATSTHTATGDTITFGGQKSQLVNDSKMYVTGASLNDQLSTLLTNNNIFNTGSSTAASYPGNKQFTGQLGIINAPTANNQFSIAGTGTLGQTAERAINIGMTFSSSATTSITGINIGLTQGAGITTANAANFSSTQSAPGAGSTITRYVGFRETGAATHPATNSSAFSDNTSFTGNWFLNQSGTDPNLLTGPTAIHGTSTSGDAAAGFVGEYVFLAQTIPQNLGGSSVTVDFSGNLPGTASSISLTAGDWDVTFFTIIQANGATGGTFISTCIGTATGNNQTGCNAYEIAWGPAISVVSRSSLVTKTRVSISSTTSYFGKVTADYTGGPAQYYGILSARRVR